MTLCVKQEILQEVECLSQYDHKYGQCSNTTRRKKGGKGNHSPIYNKHYQPWSWATRWKHSFPQLYLIYILYNGHVSDYPGSAEISKMVIKIVNSHYQGVWKYRLQTFLPPLPNKYPSKQTLGDFLWSDYIKKYTATDRVMIKIFAVLPCQILP